MQALNWNDLRYVLAVARAESFIEAGRRLQVNESTVARRIDRVEKQLGARLFERNAGHMQPTAAGLEVVSGAEKIELQVQSTETAVSGVDQLAAGSVRITSVPVLANHVIVPALPGLLDAHPQLEIEVIAEPRDLSLTRREADLAVRLARPQKEARTVARRVGCIDYAVYAPTGSAAGLLPWIGYDDRMADLPQALWISKQVAAGAPSSRVAANDAESILASVGAGLGKSLLPIAVARQFPALQRVADDVVLSREAWLIVHPELRNLARIRTVMDWLVELFGSFRFDSA